MKTITLEDVVQAYNNTGIKPICGSFIDTRCNGGCALTALVCNKLGIKTAKEFRNDEIFDGGVELFVKALELPEDFDATAFYDGFDNNGCSTSTDEYEIGYNIRKGLADLGMIEDPGESKKGLSIG